MTTDQIIYLVLGGAGLGVLLGALTRVSPGGGSHSRRAADPRPSSPQPPPTAPESPLNRLREIAREIPKPE